MSNGPPTRSRPGRRHTVVDPPEPDSGSGGSEIATSLRPSPEETIDVIGSLDERIGVPVGWRVAGSRGNRYPLPPVDSAVITCAPSTVMWIASMSSRDGVLAST
jgi:hypothetical protein